MKITINNKEYPLKLCPRLVNGKPCNTAMNPASLPDISPMCTGCIGAMKKWLKENKEYDKILRKVQKPKAIRPLRYKDYVQREKEQAGNGSNN